MRLRDCRSRIAATNGKIEVFEDYNSKPHDDSKLEGQVKKKRPQQGQNAEDAEAGLHEPAAVEYSQERPPRKDGLGSKTSMWTTTVRDKTRTLLKETVGKDTEEFMIETVGEET